MTKFDIGCTLFTLLPVLYELYLLHILENMGTGRLILTLLAYVKCYLDVLLIYISLMTNEVDSVVICFQTILIPFFIQLQFTLNFILYQFQANSICSIQSSSDWTILLFLVSVPVCTPSAVCHCSLPPTFSPIHILIKKKSSQQVWGGFDLRGYRMPIPMLYIKRHQK